MKREFGASFAAYVGDSDVRRLMLDRIVSESVSGERAVQTFVEKAYLPCYDFAALLTTAVSVDPKSTGAKALLKSYDAYLDQRSGAEADGEDSEQIVFDPKIDLLVVVDPSVSSLKEFFDGVLQVEGGRQYLGQVLVCLIWAHGIKRMVPSLYKPVGGSTCRLTS